MHLEDGRMTPATDNLGGAGSASVDVCDSPECITIAKVHLGMLAGEVKPVMPRLPMPSVMPPRPTPLVERNGLPNLLAQRAGLPVETPAPGRRKPGRKSRADIEAMLPERPEDDDEKNPWVHCGDPEHEWTRFRNMNSHALSKHGCARGKLKSFGNLPAVCGVCGESFPGHSGC